MARAERIMVSAGYGEAVDCIQRFPELTGEKEYADFHEFHFRGISKSFGDLAVIVEDFDGYDGYSTAIDVYQSTWGESPERFEFFFELLKKRTSWDIGALFDESDVPLMRRRLKR